MSKNVSTSTATSNDLIDGLIRAIFSIEPDVMASLSHGDDETRLRLRPGMERSSDPLDGLAVFLRSTVAASIAMRNHHAGVSLVTERQARAAGWPTAQVANVSLILAWAIAVKEPTGACPILLEADEGSEAQVGFLFRGGDHLQPLETLLETLTRLRRTEFATTDEAPTASLNAPAVHHRKLVQLSEVLKQWLGVDASAVEIPADSWGPRQDNCNTRAVGVAAWIVGTAIEGFQVLQTEEIMAVRLKTNQDAALAGEPGANSANLALLLAAAANHAAGVTVHFLPPTPAFASALVEAARSIGCEHRQPAADPETATVQRLDIEDLAARGYIHIGRRAAARVAHRLFDEATGTALPHTRLLADERAR